MANIIEEELIGKYDSTNRNKGYNMKSGGLNHIPSEETRKLMSEAHKGENHWNYGKHWDDDFKTQLREIHTGREISQEWRENMSKGQKKREKFSEEHREKLSFSKRGSKNPMYGGKHIILQYDFDGNFIKEWESIKYVAEEYDVDQSNISRCCNGISKSCRGYIWRYKNGDYINRKIEPYPYKKKTKKETNSKQDRKVFQYTKEGYYIKEFQSAKEVEAITGIRCYGVHRCCNGKLYTFKNYRWSYNKMEKLPDLKDTNYYKGEMISVIQFDRDLNLIQEWESASEAERILKIDKTSIGRCCRGKQMTAGGYKWKYKSDCT